MNVHAFDFRGQALCGSANDEDGDAPASHVLSDVTCDACLAKLAAKALLAPPTRTALGSMRRDRCVFDAYAGLRRIGYTAEGAVEALLVLGIGYPETEEAARSYAGTADAAEVQDVVRARVRQNQWLRDL